MKALASGEVVAALIGAAVAIAFVGTFFVYLPMKQNFERNGCVFLECSQGD